MRVSGATSFSSLGNLQQRKSVRNDENDSDQYDSINYCGDRLIVLTLAQAIMRIPFLSCIVLVVLSLTATAFDDAHSLGSVNATTFLGGTENLGIVLNSKEIRVFRILSQSSSKPSGPVTTVDGYNCKHDTKVIRAEATRNVLSVLCNTKNFGTELMCDFDPGVIFRLSAPAGTLDVAICFHCHEMILFRDGKVVHREVKWARTKNTFGRDAYKAFIALTKKAFLNDLEIRTLPKAS